MGWFGDYDTKAEAVNAGLGSGKKIASTVIGNVAYYVAENGQGERYIGITLLERQGVSWRYKPMGESEGPYGAADCPTHYFDLVPEAPNAWAAEWRAGVIAKAAKMQAAFALRKTLAVGTKLAIGEPYKPGVFTVTEVGSRIVARLADNGRSYRLTPDVLMAATVIA